MSTQISIPVNLAETSQLIQPSSISETPSNLQSSTSNTPFTSTSTPTSIPTLTSTATSTLVPTSSTTTLNNSNNSNVPVAIIVGVTVGVLVIMTLVAIFAFLRRRKRHPSKTSPIMSSKGYDLEQQLNLNNTTKDKRGGDHVITIPRTSHHSIRKHESRESIKSAPHTTITSTTSVTNPIDAPPVILSLPLARDHIPPRTSSVYINSSKAPSIHSLSSSNDTRSIDDTSSITSNQKQSHKRQPSSHSLSNEPQHPPPVPPIPAIPSALAKPVKTEDQSKSSSKPSIQKSQPTDCHIDMVSVDVESLMPIIISDEVQVNLQPNNTQIHSQQQQTPNQTPNQQNVNNDAQDNNNTVSTSIMSPVPIMPTPTPRRQSLAGRKSLENAIGGRNRISMTFLPPPPPPSIPPPAIPLTYPGGLNESRTRSSSESSAADLNASIISVNARGRRPRASMESLSNGSAARRSVSLDSSTQEDLIQDLASQPKVNGLTSSSSIQRATRKLILPPTAPPPPPVAKPQQQQPVHTRRRQQKNQSQILNTGFFVSPDRTPLSPLSPPHSPLSIQIPRNIPPRSNSALSNYPTGPANTTNASNSNSRADSPTAGSGNLSPPLATQFQYQLPSVVKAKLQAQSQNKRNRSKSIGQTESHRTAVSPPSASAILGLGPRSPPMPGHLSDHLPPPPLAHTHLIGMRRPSLPHQQQQILLRQQMVSNGWEDSSRPSTSTPTAASEAASNSSVRDDDDDISRRRSTSFDSWIPHSYNTSPTTSMSMSDIHGNNDHCSVIRESVEKDLELQAIIANARRIAAEKVAAIEEARRSNWGYQSQYNYSHSLSRRSWMPSEENYRPLSITSSRSESPNAMLTTRTTSSPSQA